MKDNQDIVLECRVTKIELEHELLLREMEAILVAMVGIPISAITLILQFGIYHNALILLMSALITIMGLTYLDDYRSDRRDKLIAKEKELDALIIELTKKPDQGSNSR
jgi:hypothetical protein